MTCEDCSIARDGYPAHRVFNPLCAWCGGRYIRLIGQQPIAESKARDWRRKVLADWMKYGHTEEELRRLAKLPLAQCIEPTGLAASKAHASPTRSKRR